MRDGKGDFEVAAVVGGANEGGDEGFEGGGIVVHDAPIECEGAHGEGRGVGGLDVGICVWSRLLRAVNFDAVAAIGLPLRQGDVEVLPSKTS